MPARSGQDIPLDDSSSGAKRLNRALISAAPPRTKGADEFLRMKLVPMLVFETFRIRALARREPRGRNCHGVVHWSRPLPCLTPVGAGSVSVKMPDARGHPILCEGQCLACLEPILR
jgi:hypothetical protein